MRRKIIGIFMCMLMIANVLTGLVSSEEKQSAIEKMNLFVFKNTLNPKNGKYGFLDYEMKSRSPGGIFAGRKDNLAPNPSFEEGDTMPTGWVPIRTFPNDSKAIFHWDSDYARSGEKSIGILNLTLSLEMVSWETTEYIPVDFINYSYELSAWYKFVRIPTENTYVGFTIRFYNESYNELGSAFPPFLNSSSEWLQGLTYPIGRYSWFDFPDAKYVKLDLDIWSSGESDSLVEVRFDDVYFGIGHNNPPNSPIITGSNTGKPGKDYEFTFLSTDPDGEQIYYWVDWGDETGVGFGSERVDSGQEVNAQHSWYMDGTYTIKAEAYDSWGVGSDQATFTVNITSDSLLPSKGWMKTFGGTGIDWGYDVQQTTDGGYIMTGLTTSFGADQADVLLMKTDKKGNEEWNRTFGGTGDEIGSSVQQTTDGGYIIVGVTVSYANYTYNADVWLIKTDNNGEKTWDRIFGGTGYDWGYDVQQTRDDGYIIVGTTTSIGTDGSHTWLIKTDDNGNEEWNKTFGETNTSSEGFSVQQTRDGGYIITGITQAQWTNPDVWLVKTNRKGEKVWDRTFGGTDEQDSGMSVQQTIDGGYIITGTTDTYGTGISSDVWLIKTNRHGRKVWMKTFGGIGYDYGTSVQQTKDWGYIITGFTTSFGNGDNDDVFLIKTNRHGRTEWMKTYGGLGNDRGYSVQQTRDGGYIIIGVWGDNSEVFLIKTDRHGKVKVLLSDDVWFEKLCERSPNAFPLLRQLRG